jgi:hypothetical protein
VRNIFGLEFLLDAGFPKHEDFTSIGLKVKDAGDIYCGAVGGGEDLFLCPFISSYSITEEGSVLENLRLRGSVPGSN